MNDIERITLAGDATVQLLERCSLYLLGIGNSDDLQLEVMKWQELVNSNYLIIAKSKFKYLTGIYDEVKRLTEFLPMSKHLLEVAKTNELPGVQFDDSHVEHFAKLKAYDEAKICYLQKECMRATVLTVNLMTQLTDRQEIILDECEPGPRTIKQLTKDLDVSRGTIQAEVTFLKSIGRLEQVRRKGGYKATKLQF